MRLPLEVLRGAGICVFLSCLAFGVAQAQIRPAEYGQGDISSQTIIEEIVVTATRRESALQDVAKSVGVLTGKVLTDMRAMNFEDYWRSIPSMIVTDSGPFGTRVALRGLSSNTSARSDEALTAVYIDDTPIAPPEGFYTAPPDIYLMDVDRIEVLRGPQGTLFGASSMGGAVRTMTNKPDSSRTLRRFDASVSNTHHGDFNYEVNAVFNQPIREDRSAVRLVAFYSDMDGYIDDIGLGRENVNWSEAAGLRLSASTLIRDNASLTARVYYQDVESGSFNEVDHSGKPEIGLPTTNEYQLALLSAESRSDTFVMYNLELAVATDAADWISVTSYFENESNYAIDIGDEMNLFAGGYLAAVIAGYYDQQAFTQEFRVASKGDGQLDWLGGAFYLDQEVPRFDIVPAPGFHNLPACAVFSPPPNAPVPTCTGFPDGEEILLIESITATREDYGVFGELGYRFNRRWEATVGARWYQVEKTQAGTTSGIWSGGFDLSTNAASDEDGVTAKGSLKFRVDDDLMFYALASQGFRPGGANDAAIVAVCPEAPAQYVSDELWNYEIGAKTSWLDRRVTLNGTLYHIDWSDAQIVVSAPGCPFPYSDNVGQATSEGIELELGWLINDAWYLAAGIGIIDATLDEAQPNNQIDAPAGTELPNVPEMTANLATTWRFRSFGLPGFFRADAQYTGSSYSNIDHNIRVRTPSYTLVDLTLGIETDAWRTELFVDNLLDEQAMQFCCRLNGEFVTNRPRTIGIRAIYSR